MVNLDVVSYGGGVQSTALLVLAATGHITARTFLFANVGEDSEHPDTIRYLHEIAEPYAAENGISLHDIPRTWQKGPRKGQVVTLWGELMQPESRSIPIPVRMQNTGAPGARSCTVDYKIKVVTRWLRQHGATPDNPATVAIGISTDEFERANNRRLVPTELPVYPLLTLDHPLAPNGASRSQCEAIIRSAGLPVPPKSSCFFCPFHRPAVFAEQARTHPELFARSVELEDELNRRRTVFGKDPVYLTRFGRPLSEVFGEVQGALFEDPAWHEDEGFRCGDRCDT